MKKSSAFWVYAVFFALFGFVLGVKTALDREEWTLLEIQMTSSVADEVQLFFDRGAGYNGDDLRRARTFEPGVRETLLFRLPHEEIRSLRLDPMQQAGEGVIHQVQLTLPRGREQLLELADIQPLNEIERIELTPDGLAFATIAGAGDPYFLLSSTIIPASARPTTGGLLLFGLIGFAIAAGIALAVRGVMVYFR
jgi:hypothetical protein